MSPKEEQAFKQKLESVLQLKGANADKFLKMVKQGEITYVNFQTSYDAVVRFNDGYEELVDSSNVFGRVL